MSKLLKEAAKMAILLEMKDPGSIHSMAFPKAVYHQAQLDVFQKKERLKIFFKKLYQENAFIPEANEICQQLGMIATEYSACYQSLKREGVIK